MPASARDSQVAAYTRCVSGDTACCSRVRRGQKGKQRSREAEKQRSTMRPGDTISIGKWSELMNDRRLVGDAMDANFKFKLSL